jgi:hypothetical protein
MHGLKRSNRPEVRGDRQSLFACFELVEFDREPEAGPSGVFLDGHHGTLSGGFGGDYLAPKRDVLPDFRPKDLTTLGVFDGIGVFKTHGEDRPGRDGGVLPCV